MKILDYLYYKYYRFGELIFWKREDKHEPEWTAVFIFGIIHFLLLSIMIDVPFFLFNLKDEILLTVGIPRYIWAIFPISVLLFLYLYFIREKRFTSILKYYSKESRKQKNIGNSLVALYSLTVIIIAVYTGLQSREFVKKAKAEREWQKSN